MLDFLRYAGWSIVAVSVAWRSTTSVTKRRKAGSMGRGRMGTYEDIWFLRVMDHLDLPPAMCRIARHVTTMKNLSNRS